MTDDIVTRLNNDAERCFITEVVRNYADAVGEIERLRKEIERQDAEILEINMLWNTDKAKLEALRDV